MTMQHQRLGELSRQIHLGEKAIISSTENFDVREGFLFAAHGWINENLSPERHDETTCDRINDTADWVGMSQNGDLHYAVVDGLGDLWHFYGTKPAL